MAMLDERLGTSLERQEQVRSRINGAPTGQFTEKNAAFSINYIRIMRSSLTMLGKMAEWLRRDVQALFHEKF